MAPLNTEPLRWWLTATAGLAGVLVFVGVIAYSWTRPPSPAATSPEQPRSSWLTDGRAEFDCEWQFKKMLRDPDSYQRASGLVGGPAADGVTATWMWQY
jgi:hypothetical protein